MASGRNARGGNPGKSILGGAKGISQKARPTAVTKVDQPNNGVIGSRAHTASSNARPAGRIVTTGKK